MKKKIAITTLIAFGLFLGGQVLGAEIFGDNTIRENTAEIENSNAKLKAYLPIKGEITAVSVYVETFPSTAKNAKIFIKNENEDILLTLDIGEISQFPFNWKTFDLGPIVLEEGWYWLEISAFTTNSGNLEIAYGTLLGSISNFGVDTTISIYATYNPILPPPPPPPFVETDENFVAGIIGYVRALVGSGITPLLAIFIGIPFAFVVIRKVIALMPKK